MDEKLYYAPKIDKIVQAVEDLGKAIDECYGSSNMLTHIIVADPIMADIKGEMQEISNIVTNYGITSVTTLDDLFSKRIKKNNEGKNGE